MAVGAIVAGWVLHAVWRGDGYLPCEGRARPGDAPRRPLFVLVPLAATAAGGVLTDLTLQTEAAVAAARA